MCYGPFFCFTPASGSVAAILGSRPGFARANTRTTDMARLPNIEPKAQRALCTCVVQESIAGLGTCLKEREQPPQLVVPSHDRRRLLIPGVRWGSFFTELCRPNKTLLSSVLSHLACQAGIPLADETQKSKIGQLLRTGATNRTGHTPHTVHYTMRQLRQWAIKRLTPPTPRPCRP